MPETTSPIYSIAQSAPTESQVARAHAFLTERLSELATMRAVLNERFATRRRLMDAFDAEHRELLDDIAAVGGEVTQAEQAIRDFAATHFDLTGDRRPVPGIEVIQRVQVDYDQRAALQWAASRGLAVRLDRMEFDRIMRGMNEMGRPDFVTVSTRPFARIASDIPNGPAASEEGA